jgi:hypothetical protein
MTQSQSTLQECLENLSTKNLDLFQTINALETVALVSANPETDCAQVTLVVLDVLLSSQYAAVTDLCVAILEKIDFEIPADLMNQALDLRTSPTVQKYALRALTKTSNHDELVFKFNPRIKLWMQ